MRNSDLSDWLQAKGADAQSQIELFTSGGVKAILQMPDGTTQEITAGVISHQRENLLMFERIVEALAEATSEGSGLPPTQG